jgi:adenosylmethionine-8-amino-7-oxononanoate aminotransferase
MVMMERMMKKIVFVTVERVMIVMVKKKKKTGMVKRTIHLAMVHLPPLYSSQKKIASLVGVISPAFF